MTLRYFSTGFHVCYLKMCALKFPFFFFCFSACRLRFVVDFMLKSPLKTSFVKAAIIITVGTAQEEGLRCMSSPSPSPTFCGKNTDKISKIHFQN